MMPRPNCPRPPVSADPPHRSRYAHGETLSASLAWGSQNRQPESKHRRRQNPHCHRAGIGHFQPYDLSETRHAKDRFQSTAAIARRRFIEANCPKRSSTVTRVPGWRRMQAVCPLFGHPNWRLRSQVAMGITSRGNTAWSREQALECGRIRPSPFSRARPCITDSLSGPCVVAAMTGSG